MVRLLRVTFLCSLSMLTACAAIIEGSRQQVKVETMPPSQSTCTIKNGRGDWNVAAPYGTEVKKSKTDIVVNCLDRPSGFAGTKTYPSSSEPWVWGNILIGGLIGLGVDFGTGAAWDYPEAVTIPIVPTYQPAIIAAPVSAVTTGTLATPTPATVIAPVPTSPPVLVAPASVIAPLPVAAPASPFPPASAPSH